MRRSPRLHSTTAKTAHFPFANFPKSTYAKDFLQHRCVLKDGVDGRSTELRTVYFTLGVATCLALLLNVSTCPEPYESPESRSNHRSCWSRRPPRGRRPEHWLSGPLRRRCQAERGKAGFTVERRSALYATSAISLAWAGSLVQWSLGSPASVHVPGLAGRADVAEQERPATGHRRHWPGFPCGEDVLGPGATATTLAAGTRSGASLDLLSSRPAGGQKHAQTLRTRRPRVPH